MVQPDRLAARAERVAAGLGRARPVAAGPGPHRHRRPRPRRLPPARPDGRADGRRPGARGGRDAPRAARRARRRGLARPAAGAARRPAPADLRPTAGSDELPPDLAATVRSRVGYPVRKADVLAGPGGVGPLVRGGRGGQPRVPAGDPAGLALRRDHPALGAAAQLRPARRIPGRLGGGRASAARRPALLPGLGAVPGAGRRAARRDRADRSTGARDVRRAAGSVRRRCWPPTPGPPGCRPWSGPRPMPPERPAGVAAARGRAGPTGTWSSCPGTRGRCWPVRWASPSPIFGEWGPAGFRPLSLLPDADGRPFSADVAGQAA